MSVPSEIRVIFVHAESFTNPDWNLIAQTTQDYDIPILLIEIMGNNFARYPSTYIPSLPTDELAPAIAAAHSRGIKLHISMNVLDAPAYEGDGVERSVIGIPMGGSIADLQKLGWMCPTKQASRQLLKNLVQEVTSKYGIDGFMFDYMRYSHLEMCYCDECQAKFIADTGLTDVIWPNDVVATGTGGTGKYYADFAEWHIHPINELVRDMRSWILAVKPNLSISAAAWNFGSLSPTYWRYWIGQDAVYWISQGWLDWIAPMMYGDDLTTIATSLQNWNNAIGGPEGIIPLVPFITNQIDFIRTPERFSQYIEELRANKADGWVIWRYGGLGDQSPSPDIRPYLDAINLFPVFTVDAITAQRNQDTALISWKTSLPATSKVLYSDTPLYTTQEKYLYDFRYYQLLRSPALIVEDSADRTEHNISVTDLDGALDYHIQLQSSNADATATTKPCLLSTAEQPTPSSPSAILAIISVPLVLGMAWWLSKK